MNLAEICRTRPGKRQCRNGDCPSTTYLSHAGRFCVICDHEMFEPCRGCGSLLGWCQCGGAAQPAAITETPPAITQEAHA